MGPLWAVSLIEQLFKEIIMQIMQIMQIDF